MITCPESNGARWYIICFRNEMESKWRLWRSSKTKWSMLSQSIVINVINCHISLFLFLFKRKISDNVGRLNITENCIKLYVTPSETSFLWALLDLHECFRNGFLRLAQSHAGWEIKACIWEAESWQKKHNTCVESPAGQWLLVCVCACVCVCVWAPDQLI